MPGTLGTFGVQLTHIREARVGLGFRELDLKPYFLCVKWAGPVLLHLGQQCFLRRYGALQTLEENYCLA